MRNKFTLKKNFESLYDQHASNMYGCIFKIVQEENKSQLYLRKIFQELYFESTFSNEPIWFIKYAMKKAFFYLKQENNDVSYSGLIKERAVLMGNEISSSYYVSTV